MGTTDRPNVYFDPVQLTHRPRYEWTFGRKIDHPETTLRASRILAALERHEPRFRLRAPPKSRLTRELEEIHDPPLLAVYAAATKRLAPGRDLSPVGLPEAASDAA